MVISVRTFEGNTITLDAQITDTVQNVKREIQTKAGIRSDLQRLMFANEQLKNEESLSSYGVREDTVLHLVLRKFSVSFNLNTETFYSSQGRQRTARSLRGDTGKVAIPISSVSPMGSWWLMRIKQ